MLLSLQVVRSVSMVAAFLLVLLERAGSVNRPLELQKK
jgi:hypothetical protein